MQDNIDDDEEEIVEEDQADWQKELKEVCTAMAKGRNYREDVDDFDDAAMEVSWHQALAEDNRRYLLDFMCLFPYINRHLTLMSNKVRALAPRKTRKTWKRR